MPAVNPGEIWMTDPGLAADVRSARLLTGQPANDALDPVTVLLHTTARPGNRREAGVPAVSPLPGVLRLRQFQTVSTVRPAPRRGALPDEKLTSMPRVPSNQLGLPA
jgi:mRNA-degrading endonuclease toxin of MazEF toxin-antitoxin module